MLRRDPDGVNLKEVDSFAILSQETNMPYKDQPDFVRRKAVNCDVGLPLQ